MNMKTKVEVVREAWEKGYKYFIGNRGDEVVLFSFNYGNFSTDDDKLRTTYIQTNIVLNNPEIAPFQFNYYTLDKLDFVVPIEYYPKDWLRVLLRFAEENSKAKIWDYVNRLEGLNKRELENETDN